MPPTRRGSHSRLRSTVAVAKAANGKGRKTSSTATATSPLTTTTTTTATTATATGKGNDSHHRHHHYHRTRSHPFAACSSVRPIALVLAVASLLLCLTPTPTGAQAVTDCRFAPLYQANERVYHTLTEGFVDRRCYRFAFPATEERVDVLVEPCWGPAPTLLVGTGSDLRPGNATGTAEAFALEKRAVALELTGVRGQLYVMVTLPGVTGTTAVPNGTLADGASAPPVTSAFTLWVRDFGVNPPPLADPVLRPSRVDDTSMRVSWLTATDPAGLEFVDYAVFAFPLKPAYVFSPYAASGTDTSADYFLETICSIQTDSRVARPFSPLTVTLRGEVFIVSRDNATLHYDLGRLNHGYRYMVSVLARNPLGQIAMYDTLVVDTWQIGPRGIACIVILAVVWFTCVITYLVLQSRSRNKRRNMFIAASDLPRTARHFAQADIEGFFYLLPARLLKEVGQDEELIWAGRPDYSLYTSYWFYSYLWVTVLTFFILFFVGWFNTYVWTAPILAPYMVVFLTISLAFFVAIPRPRYTVYALTNKRAIIYEVIAWVYQRAVSYPYETMNAAHLETRLLPDHSGSVFFDAQYAYLFCRREPIGFWHVRNAHRAIQHISHFREEIYKEFFMHNEPFAMRGSG